MIKFKVGFTIEAKTLFSLMSKFLPIDDLRIEEIMVNNPKIPEEVLDKLLGKKVDKLKQQKPYRQFHHPSGKLIKDFIVEFLEEQPNQTATWKIINKYITTQGFGKSSLNNSLKYLIGEKRIERVKNGLYRLIEKVHGK